jgi:hypothetical protein
LESLDSDEINETKSEKHRIMSNISLNIESIGYAADGKLEIETDVK